jgi:hypothetical protein
MDQVTWILGLPLLCVGARALVFSPICFVRTSSFIRRSVEVGGEVIRLEHSTDKGTTSYESYAPVFSFTASNGEKYAVTSEISSSPADLSIGEPVRVIYDPNDPRSARIHTFFQTWGTVFVSGLIGMGFVAFGCWRLGYFRSKW